MCVVLICVVVEEFECYVKVCKNIFEEVVLVVVEVCEFVCLVDLVSGYLGILLDKKQELFEMLNMVEWLEKVYGLMQGEMLVLQVEKKIKFCVKMQMEKIQCEYYLNEQMKVIQKELGDGEDGSNELIEFEEKIVLIKFSKEVCEKVDVELKKLKFMLLMFVEVMVLCNYLDWLLVLLWGVKLCICKDLGWVEQVLDVDYYGLDKVKECIVEYLVVQNCLVKLKGLILCFVGFLGVGKILLGWFVVKVMGCEFICILLGGVCDEFEICGYCWIYIGLMFGKIIQVLKKVKIINLLILFDEIDKMGQDFWGDLVSVVLEVLDLEQNVIFVDYYFEVEYDLLNVMFVIMVNSYNMLGLFLDWMEIILLVGYIEDEKCEIVCYYLLFKQIIVNGLCKGEFLISDDVLIYVICYYICEVGVWLLECEIVKLVCKVVIEILKGKLILVVVDEVKVEEYLGVCCYCYGLVEKDDQIGVVMGLVWMQVGGDLLQIEVLKLLGKGCMKMIGKLGDVMKELIDVVLFFVCLISLEIGVKFIKFEIVDIYVYVFEGVMFKDGFLVGLVMVILIVLVLMQILVCKDVVMIGEVILCGNVLVIGGLKEKFLVVLCGGIKMVLIFVDNEKDLVDILVNVKEGLKIILVSYVCEVLCYVLVRMFDVIEWDEVVEEVVEVSRLVVVCDQGSGGIKIVY